MIYKNFTFQIVMRHVLIFINMATILYPIFEHPFQNVFFITFILCSILVFQFYSLFIYLSQSHNLLNEALKMLNAGQYSITSSSKKGFKSFDELSSGLNKTIDSFKEINNKYQSQLNYLKLLIEKIDVGILSINYDGKVNLHNSASRAILGMEKINYLNDILKIHPLLAQTIEKSNYNRHLLMDLKCAETTKQISIKISSIDVLGKYQKLVAIHNISGDIIKTETEAWNRLLKILNHEIFNSVTPLSSLSNTLSMIIKNDEGEVKRSDELSNEEIKDIAESIEIIHQRSNNLMNFINGFKRLAKVPPPKIDKTNVEKLLHNVALLFTNEAKQKKISIHVYTESDIEINVDQNQLEQALINLISNSIHALKNRDNQTIEIRSFKKGKFKHIEIWDNGIGIPAENMDRIFIPFYSTRKNGTGIGLSLSRYLIQLNNGTIQPRSEVNKETCFSLIFD